MENTKYSSLVSSFFNKIKDNMFIELEEEIAYDIVISYISPACNQFQSCTQNLDDRDDVLQEFGMKLTNTNYDILVNYMVLEWLDANFIKTANSLKARLTTKDFHSLQYPQMLGKALELRSVLKSENDQLAINKSYQNSPLFDIVTNKKRFSYES